MKATKIKIQGNPVNIDGNITRTYRKDEDIFVEIKLTDGTTLDISSSSLMPKHGNIAISLEDFEAFGCPYCGTTIHRRHTSSGGTHHLSCGDSDCGRSFVIEVKELISGMGFSSDDGNSYEHPIVRKHPRYGIPTTPFKAKDVRPEGMDADFFISRGVGYDLAGFVKSKEAGNRLLDKMKEVLETETLKSWLDFREREPSRIQLKIQSSEFNLEKLDEMVSSNNDILTTEILKSCKIKGEGPVK